MMRKSVTLLLFDEVEVLDFAGPFEVFSVTNQLSGYTLFDIRTAAPVPGPITATNGLVVTPMTTLSAITHTDVLIVPGGSGTRPLLGDENFIEWVRGVSEKAELVLSVCTGALVLARAGLLADGSATTHHGAFGELAALDPSIRIEKGVRFVTSGKIITSGGISAGIDMSLHVITLLCGQETAAQTAAYMEYRGGLPEEQ